MNKLGHPIEFHGFLYQEIIKSGPWKVLKFGNKAKMGKPCVTKLGHPMIQLPVDPLLAAITWSNHFLYDFISLSHRSGRIFGPLWGLWAFVYTQLSPQGPKKYERQNSPSAISGSTIILWSYENTFCKKKKKLYSTICLHVTVALFWGISTERKQHMLFCVSRIRCLCSVDILQNGAMVTRRRQIVE